MTLYKLIKGELCIGFKHFPYLLKLNYFISTPLRSYSRWRTYFIKSEATRGRSGYRRQIIVTPKKSKLNHRLFYYVVRGHDPMYQALNSRSSAYGHLSLHNGDGKWLHYVIFDGLIMGFRSNNLIKSDKTRRN